jgi:hypothetical protein
MDYAPRRSIRITKAASLIRLASIICATLLCFVLVVAWLLTSRRTVGLEHRIVHSREGNVALYELNSTGGRVWIARVRILSRYLDLRKLKSWAMVSRQQYPDESHWGFREQRGHDVGWAGFYLAEAGQPSGGWDDSFALVIPYWSLVASAAIPPLLLLWRSRKADRDD